MMMRFLPGSIIAFALVGLMLATLPLTGEPLVLVSPGSEAPPVGFPASRPGYCEAGRFGDRDAIVCRWDAGRTAWYECGFQQKLPLPDFLAGQLLVDFYAPACQNAASFNIRFIDRDGEVMQKKVQPDWTATGWQTLVVDLKANEPFQSSWGASDTSRNRRLDGAVRLHGLSIAFGDKTSAGQLVLGAIAFAVTSARVTVDVATGHPIRVLAPGREPDLALLFTNPSRDARHIEGAATVIDPFGAPAGQLDLGLDVPGQSTRSVPLAAPTRFGVYGLDVTWGDGQETQQKRLSYAYMAPAGPTPGRGRGFLFGINAHTRRFPPEEQRLEALAAGLCGIKLIRHNACWRLVQPTADAPRDFAQFDQHFELFEQQGIESQIAFGHVPDWAVDPSWAPFNPDYRGRGNSRGLPFPNLDLYADYVTDFMRRYRGRIRFAESWNEPDLLAFANFPVEDYIRLMKAFYPAVKKGNPEAQVMTGGFTCLTMTSPDRTSHPDHMAKCLEEARGFYDIHAFHGHGHHSHYYPQVLGLHELHRRLGLQVPWWPNETAISAINIGELAQAATLFQKLLYSWAHGAIGYSWYDLRNDGFDPKENEHNFGLITKDFYPKQAYVAYNALATIYRDATPRQEYAGLPDGFQAFLFQAANGDLLLPSWNNTRTAPTRLLAVAPVAGTATRIDLFGNEVPTTVADGLLLIEAGAQPMTLRLAGQDAAPQVTCDLVQAPDIIAVHPTAARSAALRFRNPFPRPLAARLAITPPAGVAIDPPAVDLQLAAGESRELALTIPPAPDFRPAAGPDAQFDLTLTFADHLSQAFRIPARRITVVSRADIGLPADFTLDSADQLRSLVVNAPDFRHLFWTGPDDLSAEVRLARGPDHLLVDVRIRDDRHCQPYAARDSWQGDSVQLALHLPGQEQGWEFGISRRDDGTAQTHVWRAPPGFAAAAAAGLKAAASRDEATKTTHCALTIPLAAIGLNAEAARQGIAFNLIVNDNDDGKTRESYLALAPGLGGGRHAPEHFPVVCLE